MNENTLETLNENPSQTQTPPSPADLPDQPLSALDTHRLRHGKIAALPHPIREQLNLRLQNGEQGSQLLDWLNSQPEVLAVLKNSFASVPINKQNLSAWRQGGFLEWQTRRELALAADTLNSSAREISENLPGIELANNLATILTAHYARLLNKWDGEPDPKFDAKLLVLRRLSRDVARLQKCQLLAAKYESDLEEQFNQARLDLTREARILELARRDELGASETPDHPSPDDPDPCDDPAESAPSSTPAMPNPDSLAMQALRKFAPNPLQHPQTLPQSTLVKPSQAPRHSQSNDPSQQVP